MGASLRSRRSAKSRLISALPTLLVAGFLVVGTRAYPLCADSRAPTVSNVTLTFCSAGGHNVCCNAATDVALHDQFDAMGVPDGRCTGVIKSILCAKCNMFAAELFNTGFKTRSVPLLCNSASEGSSAQSEETPNPTDDYCKQVWNYCKDMPILNSPFHSSVQENAGLASSPSKLTDFWRSVNDFCASFSRSPNEESLCFNGHGVSFSTRKPSPSPEGMCLENIGNVSYNNMVPHPDGSNKAFFSNQYGIIWLATVPEKGLGDTLQLDQTSPFLDLTSVDYFNSDPGLLGIAFHPEFVNNGRFFVSYICDQTKSPSCAGRCSCDCNVGCDPSKIGSDDGVKPSQYQLVVSEYYAKDSSSKNSAGAYADPSEVRRIFTMGLLHASNHGGQLLFGPTDGYLYLMTGSGGKKGDPSDFSQNKKSLLGKILRLDIDQLPSPSEIANQSLCGNYSIPKDNPYAEDSDLQPEIWAMGLTNPWRCSFDSKKPFYFYCADDGQEQYKLVDLLSKGGNYRWHGHQNPHVQYLPWATGGNNSYTLSADNGKISEELIGGYVYRGSAGPCMYGRYLYYDVYASAMGTGMEVPPSSGKYTFTTIPFSCSKNTPIPCDDSANNPLGDIHSFGEDNKMDIFVLASKGVYRIVQPSLCGYTSPTANCAMDNGPRPPAINSGTNGASFWGIMKYVLGGIVFLILGGGYFGCRSCCNGNNCFNWVGSSQNTNGMPSAPPPAPAPPNWETKMAANLMQQVMSEAISN